MKVLYGHLLILYSIFPIANSLKCLSGHPQSPLECTSLTYCVTMKPKNGPTQHSCDGNAVGQISLCSRASARSRMTGLSSSSDYYYGTHSSVSSSSRSSRLSSHHQQMRDHSCFDGGELGQICCCSTDYCNSSTSFSTLSTILFTIIVVVSYRF